MAEDSIREIQKKLDALRAQPDEGETGTEKVEVLVNLANALHRSNPEKAEGYASRALALAERIGFRKGSAECNLIIGTSHWVRGNYNKALGCYAESLAICNEIGDRKSAASCYSNIGLIHKHRSDYEQALACYLKALRIKEELGDKSGIAKAYNNIGIIYDEQSDYGHALDYYRKALQLFESLGDKQGIAFSYNNVGVIHEAKGNLALALEHYKRSLEIKKELGDKKGIASSYMNIGTLYEEQEEYEYALEYCVKALGIFEKIKDRRGITDAYNHIGRIHTRQERYDSALAHLQKGLELAQEIGTKDWEAVSYDYLTELYQAQGDFKQALAYHRKHSDLREKIFSTAIADKIAQMQVRYETEKKEKEAEIYRGIFENTVIGMYRTTPEGRVLMANSALVAMLGYSSFDEFVQQNLYDVRHNSRRSRQDFAERIARDGVVLGLESFWSRRDGSSLPVRESARAIQDAAGNVLYYEGTVEDITQQRRTEDALKESEDKYRTIFERSPEAIILLNARARITDVNGRLFEWLGYEPREVIGKSILRVPFLPKESKAKLLAAMRKRKRGETIPPLEAEFTTRTGTTRIGEGFTAPIQDEQGEIAGNILVIADITERKRAEEALREEKEFIDTALHAQLDTFFLFEPDTGKALRWNRVFREISGYTDEEIAGMPAPASYYSPEDLERARAFTQKVLKEGTGTIELEFICKDGRKVPTEYRVSVINDARGEPRYLISIGRDITERKQAEEALREERDRAQKYLDIAGVIFVALNAKGEVTLTNRKGSEILGYEQEEIIGKNWFDSFLPESIREQTRTVFDGLMAGEIELVEYYENPILTRDGAERIIAWHNTTLKDNEGRIIGALASGEDITESKRAEVALKESEEKFRILVQHQGEGIAAVDQNEYFTFANPAAERIFGVSPESLIGRSLSEFVDQETFQFFRDQTESRKLGESNVYDVEIIRPDGDKRQLSVTATPSLSGDGKYMGAFGIFRDVTSQRETEEALRQSEEALRSTMASMDDLVFVIDKHGIFVEYYQPPGMRDLYLPPEQFLGKSFKEVMPPDVAELTEAGMSAVQATGASQRFDYPLRIADRQIWFSTTVSMRKDDSGEFAGVTAVCREITNRKMAEEALHGSRQKVVDLHGIAHRLMSCETEDEVYKLTIDGANDIIDFILCILYIAQGKKLVPKSTKPLSFLETHGEHGLPEKLARRSWRTHKTYIFGTPAELPVKGTPPQEARSGISAPIADIGVFQVFSAEPHAFDTDDARLLELLLGHVAEGLKRIRLEKALRDQAIHDSLTGVYNRHYLDQALRKETKRCKRYDRPLDLLMIDIDRFKEINDRFGHHTGDRILQRVAALLQEETRETDVMIRYGGDEFLILLPEAEADPEALKYRLSNRIAREIATDRLVDFPVTLSIGWARWNPSGSESVEAILAEADQRMYESKRARPAIDEEKA